MAWAASRLDNDGTSLPRALGSTPASLAATSNALTRPRFKPRRVDSAAAMVLLFMGRPFGLGNDFLACKTLLRVHPPSAKKSPAETGAKSVHVTSSHKSG
jgi:hypothetical protein